MAPKAPPPPADPAEAVAQVLEAVAAASGASAKATALEPVIALLGDAAAQTAVLEASTSLFQETSGVLLELATTMPADLTPELSAAAATCSQLIAAACDAGGASVVVPACTPPLLTIISPPPTRGALYAPPPATDGDDGAAAAAAVPPAPPLPAWRAADLSEPRIALLTSASTALSSLASSPQGRVVLRKGDAMPSLLALLQPALNAEGALQASAALTLSHLVESALCRASIIATPTTLSSVLGLLPLLRAPPPLADAHGLRLRSKLLLFFGFCLYDGALLPSLLSASIFETALALVEPPAAEPPPEVAEGEEPPPAPEPPSAEAVQCFAELRSNAATVIAIGGQSIKGRAGIVRAGGVWVRVRVRVRVRVTIKGRAGIVRAGGVCSDNSLLRDTYMHTCIHAHMHTCIHAYMHTCTHAHMHTCIHAHMHTAGDVCSATLC